MQRFARFFTRPVIALLAMALAAGSVFLALKQEERRLPPMPPPVQSEENSGPVATAFGRANDLDGDGQPESILAGPDGLTVTAASGATLLRYTAPVLAPARVAHLGGGYPVLFAETARGEFAAFAYDPGRGLLQALTWPDGGMRGYGEELTADGALRETVVSAGARERVSRYRLDKLRLQVAGREYQPLRALRQTPAEALTALLEAVALGVPAELNLHMPDREMADAFYRLWHGRIPPGAVRVAQADQVNAGAENGHLAPVAVWIAGQGGEAVGLRGEAAFAVQPDGVQIRRIRLEAVPLRVGSRDEAARLVQASRPGVLRPQPDEAPFYGVFRFVAGKEHFAVDAVTGKVEAE